MSSKNKTPVLITGVFACYNIKL